MNTKTRLLSVAVFICLLIFPLKYGHAQPVQLFLDTSSEAVCNLPVNIDILVLNVNGELQEDFEGVRELRISVEEGGERDKSYTISSRKAKFKKGEASFSVKNSEEEAIDLEVVPNDSGVSG